jgi:hypothetical protein
MATKNETRAKAIEEARRRWGRARIYTGHPAPTQHNPTPAAPAVAVQARRAA